MSDTKRNYTGLSSIFPDNTNQEITPQDLRDGFKSVTGSFLLSSYSTNSTLTQDDVFIDANTNGGDFTLSLPAPSADDGSGGTFKSKFYFLHNSGSNVLTISANGLGNTVGSETNLSIGTRSGVGIISNGASDWIIFESSDIQKEATWNSTYTTVNTNSATWNSSTDVTNLSAAIDLNTTKTSTVSSDLDNHITSASVHFVENPNWNSVYNSVNTTSGTWDSTYTTVNTNSASWGVDTGENNTASNQGGQTNLFIQKTGSDLEFRTLSAGSNINLVTDGNVVGISASGGGSGVSDHTALSNTVSYTQMTLPTKRIV